MKFFESVSVCFSKYANFDDRASRSEYWWFYLFGILLQWIMYILGFISGGDTEGADILSGLAALVILVPTLAVTARRLHDTGKSGWNQLWALTIIGIIPLIIWFCTEGDKEVNKFGDPVLITK